MAEHLLGGLDEGALLGGRSAAGGSAVAKDGFTRGTRAMTFDPALRWHIARIAPRMGKRALKELHEIRTDTYLPRASEIVDRRGRRVVRHTPLVVRTVFIGVRDDAHLEAVKEKPGIAEIVSHPEPEPAHILKGNVEGFAMKPARLDPALLQQFANALARGEIIAPVGLSVGRSVFVREGPFASFPGVIEELLPAGRVRVAVSIFGRPAPVELDIAQVQAI